MALYKFLNHNFPNYFEYCFSKFLAEIIKDDFKPNNYLHFNNPLDINIWASEYFEYFKIKADERIKYYHNDNKLLPIDVFEYYTGYDYKNINNFLRQQQDIYSEYVPLRIQIIKEEIAKFSLTENIVALRRISNNALNKYLLKNNRLNPGMIITEKAFLSASLNLSLRLDSESQYKPLDDETLLIIKIPKGLNGIYLEPISKRNEYEFLLQNNLQMIVEKKKKVFNNNIILVKGVG